MVSPRLLSSISGRAGFWLGAAVLVGVWLASAPPLGHAGLDAGSYFDGAARVARGLSPYEPGGGYIYPPALAQLLALVPVPREQLNAGWNALLLLSAFGTIALALHAAGLSTRAWAAAGFLLLFTQPVRWGLQLGNASILIAGMVALAAVLFESVPLLAGALIGLAALIKVIPLLFGALFGALWLRQRDKTSFQAALGCLAVLLVGALAGDNLDYVQAKSAEVQQRVAFGANFSVCAELQRALGWSPPGALALALGIASALWIGLRSPLGAAGVRVSWARVQLLAIISTPVAWSHLYVLALWPTLHALAALYRREDRARTPHWRLAAVLWVLAVTILSRTALWYQPNDLVGEAILPLAPLAALLILGAQQTSKAPSAERARPSEHALDAHRA